MTTERNDIASILSFTTLKVEQRPFRCGCWGKHQPPYVDDETRAIILETGIGYRSNKHQHGQNVYVMDIAGNMALVEFRKYGDLYGAGLWHYLLGVDNGHPWMAHVGKAITTVPDAVDSLRPAEIARFTPASKVRRQGDWFFLPVPDAVALRAAAYDGPLDDDHRPYEQRRTKASIYVRGRLGHAEHRAMVLKTWHKAIRNKAIRTGRLALGRNAD